MIDDLKEELAERNIKRAIIRQRPEFNPTPAFQLLHEGLLQNQFSYVGEINQHIFLESGLEQKLHAMQLRKIKKCQSEQLSFNQESVSNIPEVHSFLASCRKQQGLEININKQSLEQLFIKLPLNYECYTIRNNEGNILAATVLVLVNDQIVYNYLPGFDRSYKSLSPLSFLLFQLYQILRERNYKIFDLGISSINGGVQEGLYNYKNRMGANKSDRFVYEIKLK
ncbi:GNAT family N-acetyltransferase [Reichenbachiella sp.]